MELKDVILSTLAEMEDDAPVKTVQEVQHETAQAEEPSEEQLQQMTQNCTSADSELMYLNSIRERLLVLFEGFQAPNNSNIEAKVDMTLNFLEYTLATIDVRVEKLEKRNLQK
jgi:hypothetical protein